MESVGMYKGLFLGVTASPIIINVTALELDLNIGYALAALIGWLIGLFFANDLTIKVVAGGVLLSVILTLWVGAAIASITADMGVRNLDSLAIAFLSASGINFAKSIIEVVKTSTIKGIENVTDSFFQKIANKLSKSEKNKDSRKNYEDEPYE